MGITPPDPGNAIAAAKLYSYDSTHEAFSTTAGPRYLYPEGSAPAVWVLTSSAERKLTQQTYDILRGATGERGAYFTSGGLRYGLFDDGVFATAEPV